jgi:hypothetical protein
MNKIFRNKLHDLWQLGINYIDSISPVLATRLMHFKVTGELLNLKNPVKFNDKLQWLKLYRNDPLVVKCTDKYEMYNYVKENGAPNILNNLLVIYNTVDDIDWELLPEKFALKCTHGCGYNIVTNDKSKLDKEKSLQKLRGWMSESFGRNNLEKHYDRIKPRIILEEYIENDAGLLPLDYKIYCFNGVAKLVLVCSEREKCLKLDFFDLDWERLYIGNDNDKSDKEVKKPSCFNAMVKYSEDLAKPFSFVRVDFYDKNGSAILGELTFTPAANMSKYYNKYGQKYLGDLLYLPERNII